MNDCRRKLASCNPSPFVSYLVDALTSTTIVAVAYFEQQYQRFCKWQDALLVKHYYANRSWPCRLFIAALVSEVDQNITGFCGCLLEFKA